MAYSFEKRKPLFIYSIVFFCLLCLTGCDRIPFLSKIFPSSASTTKPESASVAEQPEIKGNFLARVDNWVLTLDDFNQKVDALQKLSPDFKVDTLDQKKKLLDELINQQLLVKEAKARGLDKKKEVADAVKEFERGLLVRSLATQLTEDVKVDSKEIEDYYNQNKDKDPYIKELVQLHLREIVVSTPIQANNILIELLKGADFASLATQYSKADSAKRGGDLGFITPEEFSQFFPQLQIAIVSLEEGGLSNVVRGPDGFYIVKLEEKKGGKEKQLSEVWDYIKSGLTGSEQNRRLQDFINKLKQNANREIHEDLLR